MRKLLIIILIISGFAISSKAGPKFTYALEWGASESFFTIDRNVFFDEEHFITRTRHSDWNFHTNGFVLANVGLRVANKANIMLYGGYQGFGKQLRSFPLGVKTSYFIRHADQDGLFATIGGAFTLTENQQTETGMTANMAIGYRKILGAGVALDFRLGIQTALQHPREFVDYYSQRFIPEANVLSAESWINGVFISISIAL